MKRFLVSTFFALVGLGVIFSTSFVFAVGVANAHSGTPTPTTWSSGNTLTAANLNDTISHLHNTFSAGIVDAHVSTAAAISHSKLATPALVPKAVLSISSTCDAALAAGTDCGVGIEHSKFLSTSGGAGSGNSAVECTGTAGMYDLTLSYTPTNTNFGVLLTSSTILVFCAVTARSTTAPHMRIRCHTDAAVATNTPFSALVFDTD